MMHAQYMPIAKILAIGLPERNPVSLALKITCEQTARRVAFLAQWTMHTHVITMPRARNLMATVRALMLIAQLIIAPTVIARRAYPA